MLLHHLLIRVHRILGTLLSILFVVWFLTGMVMMYHSYPKLTLQQRMSHAETISEHVDMPADTTTRLSPLALPVSHPTAVAFERIAGRNVCMVSTANGETLIDVGSGQPIERLTDDELLQLAARWTTAAPTLLDTLNEIDVWLIGAMPFGEFPIYHYALNDGHQSELYLSSHTGRALQFTDSESRFWAWMGAIPHWIYITQLRSTGRQPWTDTVLWLSGAGIVMIVAGIILGIRAMLIARRRGRTGTLTPYAKPLFRWHHLGGLFFGLFVLTWIFSGFMSLADAAQALWPIHRQQSAKDIYAAELHPERFTLDVCKVLASGNVKRLELTEMGDTPYYHVWTANKDYLVDATQQLPQHTVLTAERCSKIVESVVPPESQVTATILYSYDNYYVSLHQRLPLPVCRVDVDDADGSTYYIDPHNGNCRYYNHNKRAGKWMYTGLHALNTRYFASRPLLRQLILWPLLIGGAFVSITGMLMGCRLITRKIRKKKTT